MVIAFRWFEISNGFGIGIVIISPKDIPIRVLFKIKPQCLNNEAKYEALIVGLEALISMFQNIFGMGKKIENYVLEEVSPHIKDKKKYQKRLFLYLVNLVFTGL